MAGDRSGAALARLVPYAPGRFLALPPLATLEVVERPRAQFVPGAAPHAAGLLAWRNRHIALVDLLPLLHGRGEARSQTAYALVVAYQPAPDAPHEYAAITLDALPDSVRVGDDEGCALPEDGAPWPRVAAGCFRHAGVAIPILDVARLFCAAADLEG